MSAPAILVEDLGKRYRLGTRLPYGRLSESISRAGTRFLKRTEPTPAAQQDYLWALRHVDLQVEEGEVIGIIGRNGAGKTTLLKILSGITEPTEGRAQFAGVVGSLLEVGAGFHPELTGRENVFLNGAVLGMRRSEIKRKFDQIVEFAEIGRFLDTPVKRYSSGMYVRLAFSVAAHLEPDILVVDEVLAVGDIDFQKRCLGKMNDVARGGRTVVFVSHNLEAVTRLCEKAAWLHDGQIVEIGLAERVVDKYFASGAEFEGERIWRGGYREPGVTELSIRRARIVTPSGTSSTIDIKSSFKIEIEYDVHARLRGMALGGVLRRTDGPAVFEAYDSDVAGWPSRREPGAYTTSCEIPANLLNGGRYSFTIYSFIHGSTLANIEDALVFDVIDLGAAGSELAPIREGVIRPQLAWAQSTASDLGRADGD